jgi:hypothetical protein
VPTGINAGVSTTPRGKCSRPRRAKPSVVSISNCIKQLSVVINFCSFILRLSTDNLLSYKLLNDKQWRQYKYRTSYRVDDRVENSHAEDD